MNWIKNILHEILGLFVDDASFALAILLWLCAIYGIASHHILTSAATAILLFAGLALILIESVTRYARHKRNTSK